MQFETIHQAAKEGWRQWFSWRRKIVGICSLVVVVVVLVIVCNVGAEHSFLHVEHSFSLVDMEPA